MHQDLRAGLTPWQALNSTQRVIGVLIGAFIALHLAASLLRGAPPAVRDILWPAFAWYGDGLRMTTTYGMFSRKGSDISVVVYGVDASGQRHLLSHSSQTERGARRRVTDVRLRKFQRHLIEEEHRRRYGRPTLLYFCRTAKPSPKRVELELVHPGGDLTAPERRELVLSLRCLKDAT